MQLETSVNNHAVPTFSIFKSINSSEKVESLKHCFMERITIDSNNPPAIIKAKDGLVYTAAYDCRLPSSGPVQLIASFQLHTYGRFVVLRLANRNQ